VEQLCCWCCDEAGGEVENYVAGVAMGHAVGWNSTASGVATKQAAGWNNSVGVATMHLEEPGQYTGPLGFNTRRFLLYIYMCFEKF
jgi:hypothetical protein